jgi:squalene-hopene/tetraprenyl-beta-curcumene cyclase
VIAKAAQWIRSVQNQDGGWGESCASYPAGCFIPAPSTASQTAWGVLGLAAAGETGTEAFRRGAHWLTQKQSPDGRWSEDATTGTGFPNVFYLTYHLYRQYFPVLALATAARAFERSA